MCCADEPFVILVLFARLLRTCMRFTRSPCSQARVNAPQNISSCELVRLLTPQLNLFSVTKSPVHDSAFAQGVRAGAAVPVGTALKSHISLGGRNAVVFSQDQVWTYSPPIILFILFPPSCFILRFLCVMLAAILVGASCAQSLSQSLYANVESVEMRTRTSASPLSFVRSSLPTR